MRILFTLPNFITAGSGRAMLNLVERLDRDRFAPGVAIERAGGAMDREVEAMGIPFVVAPFRVPAFPRATFPARAWRAARPFRGFDAWHSFNWQSEYSEAVIARLSGARSWIFTKKNMNWDRRSWHVRATLATRIVAQNTDMMERFFGGRRYRRKARLVPRGVDTGRFRPGAPASFGLRARLGAPPGAVVAVSVAQVLPVKGHPTLIRALARVPDLHLALAGREADAEYAAGLRRLVGELGVADRIHFLGHVDDVPGLLAEADVSVLATEGSHRMEGCPVALLEAMAAGVPPVATAVPGSRDVVEDGTSGLLVPPSDAEAMAAALGRLASDEALRRGLGEGARERVERRYTIEREVQAHEEVYDELR